MIDPMRSRRSQRERTRAAIEPWLPVGPRQLALVVLVALAVAALGMFTRW